MITRFLTATLCLILISGFSGYAQKNIRAFPPEWWQGFANDTLEIMVYNPQGFSAAPEVKQGPQLLSSALAPNPDYAYITLKIGDFTGKFKITSGNFKLSYRIQKRSGYQRPFLQQSDAMYLITPDRFANGDPKNDSVAGLNEKVYSRDAIYGRHGGDIQGIINKLDYIRETGFNTLWISPLLENDQYQASYHGYAITDHYKIDPRFGSNELYASLVEKMHNSGMKMIMDVVYNHFGSEHLLFQNPPDSSFFHYFGKEDPPRTNYRAATLFDPHASQRDSKLFNDGWFDGHMPDVNQRNPHVARFLIQNSIWWAEKFAVDGFRIDTYTYSDQEFMAQLGKRMHREFEDFFSFGEVWVHGPEIQSYFAGGNRYNPHETHLSGVTDFQLKYALQEAVKKEQGWTEGIAKVYYVLAGDYLYKKPAQNVVFIDNHDDPRFFGVVDENFAKWKVALGMLYTMRGIPCTYYGTEILMSETENHGVIREDFPGGWASDSLDKFTASGRTEAEEEAYQYLKTLLRWRSNSEAINKGKLIHYEPKEGLYVYGRLTQDEHVLVLVNTSEEGTHQVNFANYAEIWPEGATGRDIISGETYSESISVAPMSIAILEAR